MAAGLIAVVGLAGFARVANPPVQQRLGDESITYEVRGPAAAEIVHGGVLDRFYDPWAATTVQARLPWRLTVPRTSALSAHDLAAFSGDGSAPLTCTVWHDGVVIATMTAVGQVGCDTPP